MTETAGEIKNRLGFGKAEYTGSKSTLCTGCGHDSITAHIVTAFFQSSIHPYRVAKMSGIGCSSKTPAYFLGRAHGFNTIHGRMAQVTTGAYAVNPEITYIGVSGDGDTASIGLGGFIHMIRRNVKVIYIVENNGVYGLTKGQFSATAESGSSAKSGELNPFASIDICSLALESGAQFVARSFSGDGKQLVSLLNLALRYDGTSVIDIISPCVTFANHSEFPRSYESVRANNIHLQELGFIQPQAEIAVDYRAGEIKEVELHDGSRLILKKLDQDHDVTDRNAAAHRLQEARDQGQVLTGLFYWNQSSVPLKAKLELPERPLSRMTDSDIRPAANSIGEILKQFT